jgi:hypothetical protein
LGTSGHLTTSSGSLHQRAKFLVRDISSFPSLLLALLQSVRISSINDEKDLLCNLPIEDEASLRVKKVFDELGSDKASLHNYHRIYSKILGSLEIRHLLEIGVGSQNPEISSHMPIGFVPKGSLYAWEKLLPKAKIYGADIDRTLVDGNSPTVLWVDQFDEHALKQLVVSCKDLDSFQVIVDDGFHSFGANLNSFIHLNSLLSPKGYYVIEDINPNAVTLWLLVAKLIDPYFQCKLYRDVHGYILVAQKVRNLMPAQLLE